MIDFKLLAKAGVHFGHQTSRWNPRMAPYIWGQRSGVHLIDVSKTAIHLERAAQFIESVAAEGKQILWVGTKKPAHIAISKAGQINMPFVTHRWIGGTLTNASQVKKSVTRLLHFEDIIEKAAQFTYNKKEIGTFQKIVDRLRKNIGGIRHLRWPVGAVVLVDVRKEQTALREAAVMGIPVIALVDTNADPSLVTYVIPANDDSPKAINIVVDYLVDAAKRGAERVAQAALAKAAEQESSATTPVEHIRIEGFEEVEDEASKASKNAKRPVAKKHIKDKTPA